MFTTSDDGVTWSQVQKLLASDGNAGVNFGFSLALYYHTMIVGSLNDGSGELYAF